MSSVRTIKLAMFPHRIQATMSLTYNFCRQQRHILLNCFHLSRTRPVCCGIHGTQVYSKTKPGTSSEPIKFTSSAANVPSKLQPRDINKYQGLIVAASLSVFMIYFFYLREENDIDEMLNVPLFDRVPALEEPHLRQMIPQMKQKGLDPKEAEIRLKELVDKRLDNQQPEKR